MVVADHTGLSAVGLRVALADRDVLRDVSISVPPRRSTALLAPSGAGKSTLLRCLVGLVEVQAGTVTLDGVDARTLDARQLRRRVGLVAQTPLMLPGTVEENLGYGLDALPADRRDSALAAAGLDPAFASRPARELSGGERARVAIARALTRDPEVLLLDEPTAALDEDTSARLGETLRGLADGGLGLLVATHDRRWAERFCDARIELAGAHVGAP
jgi:ABC-type multidrug transport system ATPase subunit